MACSADYNSNIIIQKTARTWLLRHSSNCRTRYTEPKRMKIGSIDFYFFSLARKIRASFVQNLILLLLVSYT